MYIRVLLTSETEGALNGPQDSFVVHVCTPVTSCFPHSEGYKTPSNLFYKPRSNKVDFPISNFFTLLVVLIDFDNSNCFL